MYAHERAEPKSVITGAQARGVLLRLAECAAAYAFFEPKLRYQERATRRPQPRNLDSVVAYRKAHALLRLAALELVRIDEESRHRFFALELGFVA